MTEAEQYTYQDRYIAFLDILGFSAHIDRTLSDRSEIAAIARVLESIDAEKVYNDTGKINHKTIPLMLDPSISIAGCSGSHGIYMFSDSIILTAPVTDNWLVSILLKISSLLRGLLHHSILIRGAIVQGQIYEKSHIIFGPGLIKAYKLESSAARYPRILVSEEIQLASQTIPYNVRGRESMPLSVKILRDFDGLYHLDWMLHYHEIYDQGFKGIPNDTPEFYNELKKIIEFAIKNSPKNSSVTSKIFWLANYFNSVIERGATANCLRLSPDVTKIVL